MGDELYIGLSGALAASRQLEATANNAANSSTGGYKAARMAFEQFEGDLAGTATAVADTRNGALQTTENPLHFGVQGDAWMVVQVGDEPMLTRDGNFRMNADGGVVNSAGHPVMTTSGPLKIEPGQTISVDLAGNITSGEDELGQLKLVTATNVEPAGDNLYRGDEVAPATDYSVKQGALEGSNSDPVRTMTDLIEASRYFEAMQKLLQAADEMTQRANRSAGGST